LNAIKERITEWARHVRGYDQIGAVANSIENGIEKHHAKGLECEAAWRAIEEAVVAEIAKELHRMRVVLNGECRGSRDYVFRRVAELRDACLRCGYGRREHQAPDGGGCAGDFAEQLPKGPKHGHFSNAERAELDALKRKAFEAAKPAGGASWREHQAPDGGGCAGDFAAQTPWHASDRMFPDYALCGVAFAPGVKRTLVMGNVTCPDCLAIDGQAMDAACGGDA